MGMALRTSRPQVTLYNYKDIKVMLPIERTKEVIVDIWVNGAYLSGFLWPH